MVPCPVFPPPPMGWVPRWCPRRGGYLHTYLPTYLPTYIHTYTHTHIHTYIHTYTHTTHTHIPHIHTYTHTHIHTHIHTYTHTHITKGSVSYLSSPCFSTSLGGIGGPARGIHWILAVMYWISIIRGGPPPENSHGFNSHGWRGHGPPH